jgi:hypothetical protein
MKSAARAVLGARESYTLRCIYPRAPVLGRPRAGGGGTTRAQATTMREAPP